MSMKSTFAILGSLLILGTGVGLAAQQNTAQEKNQGQERNKIRNGVQGETKAPPQNRLMFRDENGDGICDSFSDHDKDGIPNGQDPDWARGKVGKGMRGRLENNNSGSMHGIRSGKGGSNTWSNRAFRQTRTGGGKSICGKAGSRGNSRKGGKQ